jgi:TetR/AcrR family transcriptional regulator, mexJK operon transcriptional repressor
MNHRDLGTAEYPQRERPALARHRTKKKLRAGAAAKPDFQNRKVRAIISAARRLFVDERIASPSMDLIAATAAVSKATLYVYFPDREHLLIALIEHEIESSLGRVLWEPDTEVTNIEAGLRNIARRLMTFFLAVQSKDRTFHRLLEDLTRDRPDLGLRFFAAGPGRIRQQVASFLRMANTRHLLTVPNVELAAMQLISLVHGDLRIRKMLAMPRPTKKELSAIVEGAVRLFLAAYGPGAAAIPT